MVVSVEGQFKHVLLQGDAEDRKKLRAADKARIKQMDTERDIDQRLMEAEEMATMGLTCAPAAL
jgi:hypothetical protein